MSPKVPKNLFAISPLASVRAGFMGYQMTPRMFTTPNTFGITLDQYLNSGRAGNINDAQQLENIISSGSMYGN